MPMRSAESQALCVASAFTQPGDQRLMSLPQPLLECILMSTISTEDKKALRQACRHFRDIVDSRLVSTKLNAEGCMGLHGYYGDVGKASVACAGFLRRVQHVPSFNAVQINAPPFKPLTCLLRLLPAHLSTLIIYGGVFDYEQLTRLRSLTTLIVADQQLFQEGLTCITGLTRLECAGPTGSVAHLAPTLRHLSLMNIGNVSHMDRLANLEVLEVWSDISNDQYRALLQVPIKHLILRKRPSWKQLLSSIPPTLSHLTLYDKIKVKLGELSGTSHEHITCLQLLDAERKSIERFAAYLPGLRALDLSIRCFLGESSSTWDHAFKSLSRLTDLQFLGVCIHNHSSDKPHWTDEKVLRSLPSAQQAADRGVQLNVVADKTNFETFFKSRFSKMSAWALDA